jgi:hypothetical protein
MSQIQIEQLIFGITRMTERAITLSEAGMIDDAMDVLDNRERAITILLDYQDIDLNFAPMLSHLDKLNEQLLNTLLTVREKTQSEVASAHKNNTASKAYQNNQLKPDR